MTDIKDWASSTAQQRPSSQSTASLAFSDFLVSLWSFLCLYSSFSKWPVNGSIPQGSVLGTVLFLCVHIHLCDFKEHLEDDDSQMYIHSSNLPSNFRLLIQLKNQIMYFISISNQNSIKLFSQSPFVPLFLILTQTILIFPPLWMASQSIQWLKPEIIKLPLNPPSPVHPCPPSSPTIRHIACLGPSHPLSHNLMSPSLKGLLCPLYLSIYFLLVSFISHFTICNVTFICLFTYLSVSLIMLSSTKTIPLTALPTNVYPMPSTQKLNNYLLK